MKNTLDGRNSTPAISVVTWMQGLAAAGKQALAGFTLGTLPGSALGHQEDDKVMLGGDTFKVTPGQALPLHQWTQQRKGIVDRPTTLPITHDPSQSGHEGWGRQAFLLAPWTRPLSQAASMGAKICILTASWGDRLQESLSVGEGSHPFPEDCCIAFSRSLLRERWAGGGPAVFWQLTFRNNIQDPDFQFPLRGGPLGSQTHHWCLRASGQE